MTRFSSPGLRFTFLPLALAFVGCTAALGEDSDTENSPNSPGDGDSAADVLSENLPVSVDASGNACSVSPGPGVIRRLTMPEYEASLQSLFGDGVPMEEPLAGNAVEGAYSTRAEGLLVKDLSAQAISNHTDAIAEWSLSTAPENVTGCTELSLDCAEQTVRGFGRRAFRMPLSDELAARYEALFMQGENFDDAFTMTISTMLQSPYFLYRRELGSGTSDFAQLSDHELGAALSYFVTGGPPDAELATIIDSGSLRDEATWSAQVMRLLDSPSAEDNLTQFIVEWLKLDLVLSKTKTEDEVELTDTLRQAMMDEVYELVRQVYRSGGSAADLIDSDVVYVNTELATHYGMGFTSDEITAVPAGDRTGGLLGTGAYLLGHSTVDSSSPTARGVFIREKLLCLDVSPPPPSVETDLPISTGPETTRDRFAKHLVDPVCANCHEQFDGFGFAFEGYDGLGRFRTTENGLPVDTTGSTVGLESGDLGFTNSKELVEILAGDSQVDRCFQQNLLEFTSGQADWDNLCSVNQLASASSGGSQSLKDSIRTILSLPHITARPPQGAL